MLRRPTGEDRGAVPVLHVGGMDVAQEEAAVGAVRMCRLRPWIFLPAS